MQGVKESCCLVCSCCDDISNEGSFLLALKRVMGRAETTLSHCSLVLDVFSKHI